MATPTEVLDALAVVNPLAWLKRYTPASVPARYGAFHPLLTRLPDPGESQARIVYRGAAKTTLTRGMVLHAARHRHVRGVLLVRATYGDAKSDREALVRLANLAGVEALNDGDTKMVLIGDVPIWTRTPGSAVRGVHWINPATGEVVRPELAIVDDLETRATARSVEQTRKIEEWLFSDALSTASQDHPMRTVLLGTPITATSLVAKAMRQEAPFDAWADPVIVPILQPDGQPSWPDNYDDTLRARVPAITMATEYDLDPLPPDTLLFPPALTRWQHFDGSPAHRVVIGVDPAGDGEDATAAVAVALMPRGLHVIDALHHTGSSVNAPGEIGRFVRSVIDRGWTNLVGVSFEGVGAWVFMRREVAANIAPTRVTAETPTLSKVERALPLTVWHAAGALSADPSLKGGPWDVEMHSFQEDGQTLTGHDDLVDATAWACSPLTRGWKSDPPTPVA